MNEKTSVDRAPVDAVVMRRIQWARLWAEWSAKHWVDQIVRLRSLSRPTYELTPDGLKLVSDGLTDSERKMIRQCEEAIASIHWQAKRMAGVA